MSEKATGAELISRYVRTLDDKPGVYRMMNAAGDVLYVGKARSLKKRVASYTRLSGHSSRIARMITQTAAMEFVVTASETEALLLEANLIKRLKPRDNVLMRDDKSFAYILINEKHETARLMKHRGGRSKPGAYFGPFASAGAVNRTLNVVERAFLLRTCSPAEFEGRSRPCLRFQIKRCSAPCTGEISATDYANLVAQAKGFLGGKSHAIRKTLQEQMHQAAKAEDFERAAILRDRLAALAHVQAHQGINPHFLEEADVIACHTEAGMACVQVFFFRTGQNWGNRAYFPRVDKSLEAPEILQAFLPQFYENKYPPRILLVSHDFAERALLAEALTARLGRKVDVHIPMRGQRRTLVDQASLNAREALARRLADQASRVKLMRDLAKTFSLARPPRRIEVFDNSHSQGSHAVGAMIVAGPHGFVKNQYRRFNIKSTDISAGDDYGMMREMLSRRFARLLKENVATNAATPQEPSDSAVPENDSADDADKEALPAWPDLLLIDGGAGQLSTVTRVLADLGLSDPPVIAIAKGVERNAGRETFHQPGRKTFQLEPRDPVLYYVQQLRDEAHRFAIGTHRAKRQRALSRSELDQIANIGARRKRMLLNHFGSAKAISQASISDIAAVPGISTTLAQAIHNHFRSANPGSG